MTSDIVIFFDDLSPILKDLTQEDREKLERIWNGEEGRIRLVSITAVWKCPLCFTNDKTIACLCSQEQVEEYKKKPHPCPRCHRRNGIEVNMVLMGSNR